jgi:NAD(P)-dependent dehydrogenase (short-subunit alcohol dehydrogenase family)
VNTDRTALVSGATSGLGFAAAALLAEAGWSHVIITGRSTEKAEDARAKLVERTGKDVFRALALDLGSHASVDRAVTELADSGNSRIDFLLLNAGYVPGSDPVHTDEGIEMTYASSLVGHHRLTMSLLGRDHLASEGRIVIAGSEAARGDVPTMNVVNLPLFAATHFDGDLEAAAESHARLVDPVKHKSGNTYANAKLFVAWWASALSRRLPAGMTVNAVSPGSSPDTDAARNQGFMMRKVMLPIMKMAPARLGLSTSVETAAGRYLRAADFPDEVTGKFFASPPKKMTGNLVIVDLPHINDMASQEAAWNVVVRLAGNISVPAP